MCANAPTQCWAEASRFGCHRRTVLALLATLLNLNDAESYVTLEYCVRGSRRDDKDSFGPPPLFAQRDRPDPVTPFEYWSSKTSLPRHHCFRSLPRVREKRERSEPKNMSPHILLDGPDGRARWENQSLAAAERAMAAEHNGLIPTPMGSVPCGQWIWRHPPQSAGQVKGNWRSRNVRHSSREWGEGWCKCYRVKVGCQYCII